MLAGRSGSELYAAELAEALLSRGHLPVLYTPTAGRLAEQLRARAIPVLTDLRTLTEPPDIIHGHHTHETLTALLAFPGVPAIQMHHGWVDLPPVAFPRILRHVPVDDTVRERLVTEWGTPPDRIEVIRNWVDPASLPIRPPLPQTPRRALVFSNSAAHHVGAIRAACAAASIEVDAVGADVGRSVDRPGDALVASDIVFAKARAAMEGMAVGAAVVLCDRSGLGPMVRSENFDDLRRLNFGLRTLRSPVTPEAVAERLAQYDPADAARVSVRIRAEASIVDAVGQLEELYERVIGEWQARGPGASDDEMRALSAYLQTITAEPKPGIAAAALFKATYGRLRQAPVVRWLLPSPARALRLYQAMRGK